MPAQELGSTLSICSTLTHAVAVPLPVVSALLWQYGTAVPFLPGVAVAAVALVYAERRRRREPACAQPCAMARSGTGA